MFVNESQVFRSIFSIIRSIIALVPIAASAQHVGSKDLIYLSYSFQRYYDINGASRNGGQPGIHVRALNTNGYNVAMQYERVGRNNILLTAGLQYGQRHYNISIFQDLSGFDPTAKIDLRGKYFLDKTSLAVGYWGVKILTGYKVKIDDKWSLVARPGIALRLFYDGTSWAEERHSIVYKLDTENAYIHSEFANVSKMLGRDRNLEQHGFIGNNRFPNGLLSYEISGSLERKVDLPVVKNIIVGIEYCRGFFMHRSDMVVHSVNTIDRSSSSEGYFHDRNISLGLRLGLGLW